MDHYESKHSFPQNIINIEEESDPLDLSNMKVEDEETASSSSSDYTCDNCNERFEQFIEYIKHLRVHNENSLYSCPSCDYDKIKTLSKIKSHLISKHNVSKSLLAPSKKPKIRKSVKKETKGRKTGSPISLCEICSKVFDNETLLKQHLESHPNQYTCDQCDEKFKITIDFIKHGQSHDKQKLYSCTLCPFTDKVLYKMKGHLQARHRQFKKYKCDICDSRFNVLTHFTEHVFFHKGEKTFQCKICDKTFMYSWHLNAHVKLEHVTGSFECRDCQEIFESKGDRSRHMKKHNRKSFLCQICGKKLSGADKLKNHLRTHTGDKPFDCQFCNKSFLNSTRLKEHENIHRGIKPYKCSQCGKSFTQPTPLTNHIRFHHTKERPFKCLLCGKGFVGRNYLNFHKKNCLVELPDANEKPKRKIARKSKKSDTVEISDENQKTGDEEKSCEQNTVKEEPEDNRELEELLDVDEIELDNLAPDYFEQLTSEDYLQFVNEMCGTLDFNDPNQLEIGQNDSMNDQNLLHLFGNCNDEADNVPPQNDNGQSSSYLSLANLL